MRRRTLGLLTATGAATLLSFVTLAAPAEAQRTTAADGFVVSESQFNQMFPNRNSFYTYSGLTAALSAYPGFTTTAPAHSTNPGPGNT